MLSILQIILHLVCQKPTKSDSDSHTLLYIYIYIYIYMINILEILSDKHFKLNAFKIAQLMKTKTISRK